MPVPRVRDLLRLAPRERDAPHVRLVLRAVVHEVEPAPVRIELHVPDRPRHTVQEAHAARGHVAHEQIRPLARSRRVGEETAVGRPGGTRIPRGAVRDLARRTALGGKRPDLPQDGNGDRRSIRRERGIPGADVDGHVRLRLKRSDAEHQPRRDRKTPNPPPRRAPLGPPPSRRARAAPSGSRSDSHPGNTPFRCMYPLSSK